MYFVVFFLFMSSNLTIRTKNFNIKEGDMFNFIDMHCDTIFKLYNDNSISLSKSNLMIDIAKLKKSEYMLQCFAMFVPLYPRKNEVNYCPFDECKKMIDIYYTELKKNEKDIAPVFNFKDIEKNIKQNKISSLLTIEEGGVLQGKLENLDFFYNLGVRMITLTWNYKNEIASPNYNMLEITDTLPLVPNTQEGLTDFGISLVKKMNDLGIVIDCSHLGDKGFYDVIKYSKKPIVCSHSCSRSLARSLRNMTDDMLLKLKENGGVVGINFCHDFIKDDKSVATIKDIVNHVNYIKNLIGIDYIGFGSDFDGISNDDLELKDASKMPLLIKELKTQGYSEIEIDKITHLNVLRVLKANLK